PRAHLALHPFPTRRSSDLESRLLQEAPGRAATTCPWLRGSIGWRRNGRMTSSSSWTSPTTFYRPARGCACAADVADDDVHTAEADRKSTRLNSSHQIISYA